MEVPEIIVGSIITLVGVVGVEWVIHYLKERSMRNCIITSLKSEIDYNIETLDYNLSTSQSLKTMDDPFHPLKVVAYERYRLNMNSTLFNLIGLKGEEYLSNAYFLIYDINRLVTIRNYKFAGDIEPTFENVKKTLKDFLICIRDNNKICRLIGKNILSDIENLSEDN